MHADISRHQNRVSNLLELGLQAALNHLEEAEEVLNECIMLPWTRLYQGPMPRIHGNLARLLHGEFQRVANLSSDPNENVGNARKN